MVNFVFRFIIIFLVGLFNNKPSFSNIQSNNSPTKINSKTIHIKRKSNKIEFVKDAVIENGETSILADKITVFYDDKNKENKDNSSALKKAEAKGNVKIFNKEFIATGDVGTYSPKEESFILTGENVIFNNGTSVAKGKKFVYNLKTKTGVLVGDESNGPKNKILKNGKQRVMVIINESKQ